VTQIRLGSIAVLSAALCIPAAAIAQTSQGYATTTGPAGAIWKTPYGVCVRASADVAPSAECGDFIPKPAAAPVPPPVSVAPVVAPPPPPPAPAPEPRLAPVPLAPAPAPAPIPAAAPKPAPKPAALTIGAAELFGFNQATLTPAGRAKLDSEVVARSKKEYSEIRSININGHTDRLGATDYNQKLSARRAEAVRAHLVSQGMDNTKIQAIGYGKTQPVKTCPDNRNRKLLIGCLAPNRRVEIEINGSRR
jgi:OOP family OmpA-OmpF porin